MLCNLVLAAAVMLATQGLPEADQSLVGQARSTATLAKRQISENQAAATRRLAGQPLRIGNEDRTLDAAAIGAPFSEIAHRLRMAEEQLDLTIAQHAKGEASLDDVRRTTYLLAAASLRAMWRGTLALAGYQNPGVLHGIRAEVRKFELEARQAGDARSTVDLRCFQTVAPKVEALRNLLVANRQSLARLGWTWAYSAHEAISAPNDGHSAGKRVLIHTLYDELAYGDRQDRNSTLDFFVRFADSADRVVLYSMPDYPWLKARPFPNVQVAGLPGLLKLNVGGFEPLDTLNPREPSARAVWAGDPGSEDWRLEEYPDLRVAAVRYQPNAKVRLVVSFIGYPHNSVQGEGAELLVADPSRSSKVDQFSVQLRFDDADTGLVEVTTRELLERTGLSVNRNLYEGIAKIRVGDRTVSVLSKNRLHILRQSLILFIPGVFGSEIDVATPRGTTTAFPALSRNILPPQPFLRLLCGPDGRPLPGNEAASLDLFRNYGPATVYDVEHQKALENPSGHPRIVSNGRRVKHYILLPWPYDWRLRLEGTVNQLLMGRTGASPRAVRPPYPTPPSATECLAAMREEHPLLDDKVVLVGHSTGGLIARAAATRPGAVGLIERAFFVNVPFWGAPKAYYVFLTGDMGIPVVADSLMQQLAPNAPIVYYLAPTERYPDSVAVVNGAPVRRTQGSAIGQQIRRLVADATAIGAYPANLELWNMELERSAATFHRGITSEPAIGWNRCRVFWSSGIGANTIGSVFVDQVAKKVATQLVIGDGTVPAISQKADWPQDRLTENPDRPDHVSAPNQAFVWERIVEDLLLTIQ